MKKLKRKLRIWNKILQTSQNTKISNKRINILTDIKILTSHKIIKKEHKISNIHRQVKTYYTKLTSVNKKVSLLLQNKGTFLEKKDHTEVLSEISKRHGRIKHIWNNVLWFETATSTEVTGEIDMLLETDDGYIFIEIKSRVFDIMSGYIQNGPQRSIRKQYLQINTDTRIKMVKEIKTYIITSLPDSEYKLPYESKLNNIMLYRKKRNCTKEAAWEFGNSVFGSDRLTPLQWYLDYARPRGIVFAYTKTGHLWKA